MMRIGLAIAGIVSAKAYAQQPLDRIVVAIDDTQLTTLAGNVHPLATPEHDRGMIAPETRLEKMVLVLGNSPAQQAALDRLTEEQQTPGSPVYHHWLTSEEYGHRFGVSDRDLAAITVWLESHGFTVDEVAPSRMFIEFSGTAGEVAEAFHTEVHRYLIPRMQQDGSMKLEQHISNNQDPQIPSAFLPVVHGILSLHDFRRASSVRSRSVGTDTTSINDSERFMSVSDFASIFDLEPLYASGINGSGVTIAIVGRSNILSSDVSTFRVRNQLAFNEPTVTTLSADQGLATGEQDEATLDVEWSGAVAPEAKLRLVSAASSATTDGVDLSALYIVEHHSGIVMTTSFSSCKQQMGAAELSFYNGLWQQAASEGISVVVASGNRSDSQCAETASSGVTVSETNGLCASRYSTCVGGTNFVNEESASENRTAWNNTLAFETGSLYESAGASAAAPALAGIVALVAQTTDGSGLGNINPVLNAILKPPLNPFHASPISNIPMSGVNGRQEAGAVDSLASGIGSIDGISLVKAWVSHSINNNRLLEQENFDDRLSAQTAGLDPTGKADSTPALQTLFDSATSTVRIPAGTYLLGCTNPLYISRDNVAYVGAGQGETILRSCQGHTVDVINWSCKPSSGRDCTSGIGPYTFTIITSTPLLKGIDHYYCPRVSASNTCSLDNWHNEFPSSLSALFIFNGPGLPNVLSNSLTNPIFNCGAGCEDSPAEQTSFTVTSSAAPTANTGSTAQFSLPQNMIQAFDARSNKRHVGSTFSQLTFDGGCDACVSTSFDTALVDMRNPLSNAHAKTSNFFNNVTFSNYASAAVREDTTDGDAFANITFRNGGNTGIIADSPNNITLSNITATNFGWQTDVRVVNTGAVYSALFNFGCSTGGHTINIQNVSAQPSKSSTFVGLGVFCGSSSAQTATTSAYSGIQVSKFTIISAGNQLLPVSAFADNMTIQGMKIQGYPDAAYMSSPYMEVAGSNLNIFENSGIGVYFAPLDEGAYVDGGLPVHTHYSKINIHDNTINCTTPTNYDTGCMGFAIGGFQNTLGNTTVSYIDAVNIYNNVSHYTFGPVNQGHVLHISLGVNEGGNGTPAGQLTNVHVYNETVTITGSQSRGCGWSAFATLWGGNKNNANWKFDHDNVKWTNTKTISSLNHFRAMPGVVASNVTAQSESTPANPLLTNKSGGTFSGITVLQ